MTASASRDFFKGVFLSFRYRRVHVPGRPRRAGPRPQRRDPKPRPDEAPPGNGQADIRVPWPVQVLPSRLGNAREREVAMRVSGGNRQRTGLSPRVRVHAPGSNWRRSPLRRIWIAYGLGTDPGPHLLEEHPMTSRFIGYLAAVTLALSVQLAPARAAPMPVAAADVGTAETPLVQTVQHWGHHHHHGHHHHWRPRHHHHHWGHHHHWRPRHHHHGWGHHHHYRRHHHHHF